MSPAYDKCVLIIYTSCLLSLAIPKILGLLIYLKYIVWKIGFLFFFSF